MVNVLKMLVHMHKREYQCIKILQIIITIVPIVLLTQLLIQSYKSDDHHPHNLFLSL